MNYKFVITEKCPLILEKIFSKTWLLILLLLPFFKPGSFEYLGVPFTWIDTLLTVSKAGVALLACLLYLCNKKLSALTVSAAIFSVLMVLSTVLNHGNIKTSVVYAVNIVGICVLVELAARYSFRSLLRSLYYLLSILLILHLASQLIFPNGMAMNKYYSNSVYFMNIDNQMAPLVLLAMLVTILYSEYIYQRITWPAVGILAVSSAIVLKSWSASAVMGWFVFLVFLIFFYRRKLGRLFKFRYLAAAYVVIFFSIVILRLQNLFSFIIVDILHKDLTFTHRTEFWDIAYSLIKEHWFIGMGVPVEKGHIWFPYYNKFFYGHNIVIELLLVGGVLLLVAFLISLFFCGRRIMSVQNHPWAALVSAMLFSFFIVMLMESYHYDPSFWTMLVISFFIPECISQSEEFREQNPQFGERKGNSLKLHHFICKYKQKLVGAGNEPNREQH